MTYPPVYSERFGPSLPTPTLISPAPDLGLQADTAEAVTTPPTSLSFSLAVCLPLSLQPV